MPGLGQNSKDLSVKVSDDVDVGSVGTENLAENYIQSYMRLCMLNKDDVRLDISTKAYQLKSLYLLWF